MSSQIKVTASSNDLRDLREALLNDPEIPAGAIALGDVSEEAGNSRQPLGFEPLAYFVVVFAAHLSADATKGLIKMISAKYATSRTKIVESDTE